jgi:hypothetical protein
LVCFFFFFSPQYLFNLFNLFTLLSLSLRCSTCTIEMADNIFAVLRKTLSERIMIMDGATGTALQAYKLGEEDYRGSLTTTRSALIDLDRSIDSLCQIVAPLPIHLVH